VTYQCLEERTGFHMLYAFGHLKVICGSIMGPPVQLQLPPNQLRYFWQILAVEGLSNMSNTHFKTNIHIQIAVLMPQSNELNYTLMY
jgi:hypothetical protein